MGLVEPMTPLDLATCERLRDAGFPQTAEFAYCNDPEAVTYPGEDAWPRVLSYGYGWEDFPAYKNYPNRLACPDSDELLAALGDNLSYLERGWYEGEPSYAALHKSVSRTDHFIKNGTPIGIGSTPADALARLWLALNEETKEKE